MTSTTLHKCDICFLTKEYNNDNFYVLSCCKNNFICKLCFEAMLCDCCPFCREIINQKTKMLSKQTRPRSSSFTSSSIEPISYLDQHIDLESLDDNTTYYSRLYRRQQINMQRLRASEANRIKNRHDRLQRITRHRSEKKKEQKHLHSVLLQETNESHN